MKVPSRQAAEKLNETRDALSQHPAHTHGWMDRGRDTQGRGRGLADQFMAKHLHWGLWPQLPRSPFRKLPGLMVPQPPSKAIWMNGTI